MVLVEPAASLLQLLAGLLNGPANNNALLNLLNQILGLLG